VKGNVLRPALRLLESCPRGILPGKAESGDAALGFPALRRLRSRRRHHSPQYSRQVWPEDCGSATSMELQNFILKKGYLLATERGEHDLHNDYLVTSCEHDAKRRGARITLQRSPRDWVNRSQPERFTIDFNGVRRFKTKNGSPGGNALDRCTIRCIGFLYPQHEEVMDGYLDDQTESTQDLIIIFEDESAVKIGAETATLTAEPNQQIQPIAGKPGSG
jgi:hypothetical protein